MNYKEIAISAIKQAAKEDRMYVLTDALQQIASWSMHSGPAEYQKGECNPSGYYNNAFYLMEAEINKARELARAALAKANHG